MILYYETNNTDTLAHWGIKGMKWGVRRYQNANGTLTPAGKKRYDVQEDGSMSERGKKRYKKDKTAAEDKKRLEKASISAIGEGKFADSRAIDRAIHSGRTFATRMIAGAAAGYAFGDFLNYANHRSGADNIINKVGGVLVGTLIGAGSAALSVHTGKVTAESYRR